MTASSLAHMAVLTELDVKLLGMTGKDETATTQTNANMNVGEEAGYYKKCKLARADIIEVIRVRDAAREYRRSMTRPYGEKDLRILPSNRIIEYNEKMADFKTQFETAVDGVQANWPSIIQKQQKRLGPMFKPEDYPQQHEVSKHYVFKTGQLAIPDVEHFMLDIEAEVLDQVKRDFTKRHQEKMEKSFGDLIKRLHEPVAKMADICSNDKRLYDSVIQNLVAQCDILNDLNVTGDRVFIEMITEVKDRLTGYTPGQIRSDKLLKQKLGEDAEQIAARMGAFLGELPN